MWPQGNGGAHRPRLCGRTEGQATDAGFLSGHRRGYQNMEQGEQDRGPGAEKEAFSDYLSLIKAKRWSLDFFFSRTEAYVASEKPHRRQESLRR